jgi:hypothetical protein
VIHSLQDLVASAPSGSCRLGLASLWQVLKQSQGASGPRAADPLLSQQLIDLWLQRPCTDADLECIFNDIMRNAPKIAQQIPMLEMVLLGHDWRVLQDVLKKTSDNPTGSLLSWLEFLDKQDQGGSRAPSIYLTHASDCRD